MERNLFHTAHAHVFFFFFFFSRDVSSDVMVYNVVCVRVSVCVLMVGAHTCITEGVVRSEMGM